MKDQKVSLSLEELAFVLAAGIKASRVVDESFDLPPSKIELAPPQAPVESNYSPRFPLYEELPQRQLEAAPLLPPQVPLEERSLTIRPPEIALVARQRGQPSPLLLRWIVQIPWRDLLSGFTTIGIVALAFWMIASAPKGLAPIPSSSGSEPSSQRSPALTDFGQPT